MLRFTMSTILGLAAAALLAGCEQPGGDYKTAQQIKQENQAAGKPAHEDHEHAAEGPHGGALVELGDEEYHGEIVVDGERPALVVYIVGPDAKTPAPIAASTVTVVNEAQVPLELKAVPQEGDAEGKASKFELVDEAAVKPIVDAGFLHGALQVEIAGKPYRGEIDAHFDGSTHEEPSEPKDGEHKDEEQKDAEPQKSADEKSEEKTDAAPEAPSTPED
jgi:hypothetical protein